MKKLLITGANGFIGRHCLPLLAGFDEVVAVTSRAPAGGGIRWIQADLLQDGQVDSMLRAVRPSHLLHLAWYTEPRDYWTSPLNDAWLEAGIHLFEQFFALGGSRAVGAGTCAEYEWGSAGVLAEDTAQLRPATLYGSCKLRLWTALESLAQRHGAGAAWGRLFFPYGPHEREERLIPSMIVSLLHNRSARCVHPGLIRDFVHVDDAAAALAALLQSGASGVFNIGSGIPVRLGNIAAEIGRQLSRSQLVDVRGSKNAGAEAPRVVASVAKIRNELGWAPAVDLRSGIAGAVRWWMAREGERLIRT